MNAHGSSADPRAVRAARERAEARLSRKLTQTEELLLHRVGPERFRLGWVPRTIARKVAR